MSYFTQQEIADINRQQIFSLERKINRGEFNLEEIGEYVPGTLGLVDLINAETTYMNKKGCSILKHSKEELQALGAEYFTKFFVPEEVEKINIQCEALYNAQDNGLTLNFAQRVKAVDDPYFKWFFTSTKLLYPPGDGSGNKLIILVNEVNRAEQLTRKIHSVLEESDWMKNHFKKYCLLTKREKEIISLIFKGKNSQIISEELLISKLTVNTHRRNIFEKLQIKTFAELLKFATTYSII